jgi:hypothetical protein
MIERESREREWLEAEVRWAASLTDAERVRILLDLLRTADAIQKTKTPEQREREEEVRWSLEDEPALRRYAAVAERLE